MRDLTDPLPDPAREPSGSPYRDDPDPPEPDYAAWTARRSRQREHRKHAQTRDAPFTPSPPRTDDGLPF